MRCGRVDVAMLRGAANVFVVKKWIENSVATLRAGDCFGDRLLATGEPRSATVRADGDCYVMEIGKPGDGESVERRSNLHGAVESIACLQRRMETEGILKDSQRQRRACINRTSGHRQVPHRLRTFFQL